MSLWFDVFLIQTVQQELHEVKLQLTTEQEKAVDLEIKLKQLEVRDTDSMSAQKKFATLLNHSSSRDVFNHGCFTSMKLLN